MTASIKNIDGSPVFSLDDLCKDPLLVEGLPPDDAFQLLAEISSLTQLLAIQASKSQHQGNQEDRLVSLEEASRRLGSTVDWLARRKKLPFRKRLSDGQIRYSSHGIDRYIKNLPQT